jgi:predicted metallopeptidase
VEYLSAPEIDREIARIVSLLGFDHLDPGRIRTVRSRGTQSRRTLARCHALPKALQTGLGIPAHYVIELLSENFDPLPESEKTKTLIHELLHIPATFGGGFRNHDYVRANRVNRLYEKYLEGLQAATHRTPTGVP